MSLSFRFDDNLQGEFIVVSDNGNYGVAGFVAKSIATVDATKRNEKAKQFGIKSTYQVKSRDEGYPVSKVEWEKNQAIRSGKKK